MTLPLVSVKMLTYNHASFVSQAIECVLKQKTTFPFELIIGEDCSTDGTREIVFDYGKRYPDIIRIVTSDSNVGVKENSRRADELCNGKYLAWCEGDDFWHRDDKLQIQVEHLEAHPECGLVFSDFDRRRVKDDLTVKRFLKTSGRTIPKSPTLIDIMEGNGGILTCTVVAKKELVLQVKAADPHLHGSGYFKMGDTQIWAEVALLSKLHFFDESLATYQQIEESATSSNNEAKRLSFWRSNAEMCLYLCDKHNLPKIIKEIHEKKLRRTLLKLAFLENDSNLAHEVKKQYSKLSIKERVWYYGTTFSLARPIVNLLKNYFKKDHFCNHY